MAKVCTKGGHNNNRDIMDNKQWLILEDSKFITLELIDSILIALAQNTQSKI